MEDNVLTLKFVIIYSKLYTYKSTGDETSNFKTLQIETCSK